MEKQYEVKKLVKTYYTIVVSASSMSEAAEKAGKVDEDWDAGTIDKEAVIDVKEV